MENTNGATAKKEEKMNDKKAAKKIIKIYKKRPDYYSKQDVQYAKLF